jgi:hypothetical protein
MPVPCATGTVLSSCRFLGINHLRSLNPPELNPISIHVIDPRPRGAVSPLENAVDMREAKSREFHLTIVEWRHCLIQHIRKKQDRQQRETPLCQFDDLNGPGQRLKIAKADEPSAPVSDRSDRARGPDLRIAAKNRRANEN